MKIRKQLAAAALLATAFGAQAATNLLADGDFEGLAGLLGGNDWLTVTGGNTLGAWTVEATSVDLILGNYGAIDNVSVDLSGSPGPGSLKQSFTAVAGVTYTLTWDYFKNGEGTDLGVTLGDKTLTLGAPGAVTTGTLSWTATSAGTQWVSFSGGNGNDGPTLDNVFLAAAVPEPETYALMLAGLGLVVGLARRRKA